MKKDGWKPLKGKDNKEIIGLIKGNKTIPIIPKMSFKQVIQKQQSFVDTDDTLTYDNLQTCIENIYNILKKITQKYEIKYEYIISIIIGEKVILSNNTIESAIEYLRLKDDIKIVNRINYFLSFNN